MSLYQRKNYNLKVHNMVHITLVMRNFKKKNCGGRQKIGAGDEKQEKYFKGPYSELTL